MRSQRNRPQFVEIGCITLIGVGVCQQSIGLGQVVFTLCPIASGCDSRIFLMNIFIIEHRRITAVYHIAEQTKSGIDIKMHRQKLVLTSHLPHFYQIIKAKHFGTAGKTNLPHAPHVIADNHIATHKLEALALRQKPDTELPIMHFAHYGIYIVSIEFLRIGSQWRQQLII